VIAFYSNNQYVNSRSDYDQCLYPKTHCIHRLSFKGACFCLRLNIIFLVFSLLSKKPFELNQFVAPNIISQILKIKYKFTNIVKNCVVSILNSFFLLIDDGRSVIKTRKRRGPRTDPRGTPHSTLTSSDHLQ
jgi:hypothetical protein